MEVLQRTANRGSISTGYDVDNSVKLEADNNEHLSRVMVAGNRKTWTYSIWFKRTELGFTNVLIHFGVNNQATRMMLNNDDTLYVDMCDTGTALYRSITNRVFRDTSAFCHVVLRVDTTQSTEADRMKVYINGVEETSWAQHQIPPQNLETLANTTAAAYDDMGIGTYVWGGSNFDGLFSGYIAQVAHVDGQSYAPTEFGEFDDDSGIWKPKDVSGLTYGTGNNSFFLDFEDSSDLGANAKGNDVNFSLSNLSAADQATDTPTNNFCTLNPVYQAQATKYHTVSNGGTFVTGNQGGTAWDAVAATIPLFKGKWYWEIKKNGTRAQTNMLVGVGGIDEHLYNWRTLTTITDGAKLMFSYNGVIYGGGSGGFSYDDGDIISIALDQDNGGFYLRKNGGTWTNSGDPSSGASLTGAQTTPWGTSIPAFNVANNVGGLELNFGGFDGFTVSSGNSDANGYGNFEYAPPSGYYAICTKNLAEYG